MNTDSRNERHDVSSDRIREQLRALSAVEPPRGLKERLRAGIPCPLGDRVSPGHVRGWPGVTGWAGIAATIIVFCGVLWFWTPAKPSVGPEPDATDTLGPVLAVDYNSSLGQMPAADYNSVRPPDINALDSNGLQ
jgi:hypothetical protein